MPTAPSAPRVLLRSEQTGGEVSVIETAPGPGPGPRLHHHDFDEAFYVIEGELTFQLRGYSGWDRANSPSRHVGSHIPSPI